MFGLNVRQRRLAADLSQEALAEKMGVDRAFVSSMERGQSNVTLTTLWQAGEALGVPAAQLLDESVSEIEHDLTKKSPRKPRTRPAG